MLAKLYIRNFAIIRELEVDFVSNLNIITGETGAGKSILMDALSLILGERTNAASFGNEKCVIEGTFRMQHKSIVEFLETSGFDVNEELIIRREIAPGGKSRAFINDSPANLSHLKSLGTLLVDQHQQFDGQGIATESFQRSVLDSLADNTAELSNLKEIYSKLTHTRKRYDQLVEKHRSAEKEKDYHSFLFEELEQLGLKENELEELDVELKTLSNAAEIIDHLSMASDALQAGEQPLVNELKTVYGKLQHIEKYLPEVEALRARLKTATIELTDIADDLERLSHAVSHQPERIEQITDRIDVGYKLLKKHGVTSTNELLEVQADLQSKLSSLESDQTEMLNLEKEITSLSDQANKTALKISKKRSAVIPDFIDGVNKLLKRVGMPNARLKIDLVQEELHEHGLDSINFLFNANVAAENDQTRFDALGKVASGGELSRLMLSIKSLVAGKLQLPTLVFDEIDSGISGEAAKQVGLVMEEMSLNHQIIAITHQPQIAAKADAHYYVFKEQKDGAIAANIRLLEKADRVQVIASMLSGEKPSAAAIENAKEMIGI